MNSIKIKVPAKLNLTLDIVGKGKEYHDLKSLVTSINLFDVIKIEKRQDNQVKLFLSGIDCECDEKDNNAYKTAKLFVDTYKTYGVNIYLKKNIPLASGLGGSSSDIAGVLMGMKKLFNINEDMASLASKLGSDSVYLLNKGYAVISGKGDKITPVQSDVKLFAIVIWDEVTISAKEGYAGYDAEKKKYDSVTFEAVACLTNLKTQFFTLLKNDLQPYAESVMPSLVKKEKDLIKAGAECALLTGSGSAVYGLFITRAMRNYAFRKLKDKYGKHLIKCNTIK